MPKITVTNYKVFEKETGIRIYIKNLNGTFKIKNIFTLEFYKDIYLH